MSPHSLPQHEIPTKELMFKDVNISFTLENIRFRLLKVGYAQFTRLIPMHSHSDNSFEIHYVPAGQGSVSIDDMQYPLAPGNLYVTGPHIKHEAFVKPNNPMSEYCFYLKIDTPRTLTSTKTTSIAQAFYEMSVWMGVDTQDIHALANEMMKELVQASPGYLLQMQALCQTLVIKMVRNYQKNTSLPPQKPEQRRISAEDANFMMIEDYFLFEYSHLSLQELSARLGLSARQLERVLQQHYRKTFSQKKTESRMAAAISLLSHTDLKIAQIAEATGYSSSEHFSTAFSRYFQQSPRSYRKAQTAQ